MASVELLHSEVSNVTSNRVPLEKNRHIDKMIVLKEFKILQKIIGFDPLGGLGNIFLQAIYWVAFLSSSWMMCTFFVLNVRDDIFGALGMFPAFLAYVSHIVTLSHLSTSRDRFYLLLDDLQEIVNERVRREENERIYVTTEQRICLMTKLVIYGSFSLPIIAASPFTLAAYHWCVGKYSIESWTYLYPMWTPFEQNTTIRCALIVLHETYVCVCATFVYSWILCLMIGFMFYSEAFFLDFEAIFAEVSRLSKCKSSPRNKPKTSEAHQRTMSESEMLECVKEAVELHQKVIRLLGDLADLMNAINLQTIVLWATSICIALFVVETIETTNFLYDLQQPFVVISFFLTSLAINFFLGQKFNTISMNMSHVIYQSEWNQYPRSVLRIVRLMLMRSQQPYYLSAYGLMELHMENFVRLLKQMYSAFMVLHSTN